MSKPKPTSGARSNWRIFRAPLALSVISGVGLIAALLYEGPIDILWGLAVAVPVLVVLAKVLPRRS